MMHHKQSLHKTPLGEHKVLARSTSWISLATREEKRRKERERDELGTAETSQCYWLTPLTNMMSSLLSITLLWYLKNWVVGYWCGYLSGICIWPSWCHCHSLSLASVKFQIGFTFLVLAHLGSPGQNTEYHKMIVVVVVVKHCSAITILLELCRNAGTCQVTVLDCCDLLTTLC